MLRTNFRRDPVAALGVLIALVILIELQILGTYRQVQQATDDLRQSQSTLIAIEDAVNGITNVETGERVFLISGDESFLEPYSSGRDQFEDGIRRAIALSEKRPEQIFYVELLTCSEPADIATAIGPVV